MRNRTENVAINATFSLVSQIITMLLNFVSRTFFIKILGTEYLGVNGLFTNLLTVLSFAELGIGSAITFHLYRPLAKNDEKTIKKYMKIYELVYRAIGVFIIIIGLGLIPFLKWIIKGEVNIDYNINFIYVLFLLNTAVSYFYSYKSTIITADQKNYIVTFYTQIIKIIGIIIKIIALLLTKNYIVYLVLDILFTFSTNFILSKKANRMYPYIKNLKDESINKKRLKIIFRDSKSLMIYKVATVVLNGTDNILVSMLAGVTLVGYTSNYTMIITSISTILLQVLDSFVASIGNLNAERNTEKSKAIFNKILFISYWIYSYVSAMLLLLVQDFISVWLGEEYTLGFWVLFGLVLDFYLKGIMNTCVMYRTTNGLFTETKYSALLAAIMNIVLSVVMFKIIGLAGIFIATGISRVLTMGVKDGIVVFKRVFNDKPVKYFMRILIQFLIFILIFLGLDLILKNILVNNWIAFIIKGLLATILYNLLFIIIYGRKKEFKDVIEIAKNIILNIIKNIKERGKE